MRSGIPIAGRFFPVLLLISFCIIGLFFGAHETWHAAHAFRHALQQRFAETHDFLNGDGASLRDGEDVAQRRTRDDVTEAIATSTEEIPWALLATARFAEKNGTAASVYAPPILALDHRMLRAKGYIFPIEQIEEQTHFLLSPYPPSCPYCLPAAPSELIEITMKRAIPYTDAPVVVEGDFELLRGEEVKEGMFYRMQQAKAVSK